MSEETSSGEQHGVRAVEAADDAERRAPESEAGDPGPRPVREVEDALTEYVFLRSPAPIRTPTTAVDSTAVSTASDLSGPARPTASNGIPVATPPHDASPLIERALGSRYLLGEVIGRGAMGRVYRGRARIDGRPVAVKVLREDLAENEEILARFVQERQLLRTIKHPNVVAVHDLILDGDDLAIVMDLIEGGDLTHAVGAPCPPEQAADVTRQIADALQAVHDAGIVHRDLKPANVLCEPLPDGSHWVRLTDFGVSRLLAGSLTHITSVIGTPGYLAPEVSQGHTATAAADVYALGVIFYQLLTGRPPFLGSNPHALIKAHNDNSVPRPENLPDDVWSLLVAMLAKDSTQRPVPAQISAHLTALRPWLPGTGPFPVPDPDTKPLAAPNSADSANSAGTFTPAGNAGPASPTGPATLAGSVALIGATEPPSSAEPTGAAAERRIDLPGGVMATGQAAGTGLAQARLAPGAPSGPLAPAPHFESIPPWPRAEPQAVSGVDAAASTATHLAPGAWHLPVGGPREGAFTSGGFGFAPTGLPPVGGSDTSAATSTAASFGDNAEPTARRWGVPIGVAALAAALLIGASAVLAHVGPFASTATLTGSGSGAGAASGIGGSTGFSTGSSSGQLGTGDASGAANPQLSPSGSGSPTGVATSPSQTVSASPSRSHKPTPTKSQTTVSLAAVIPPPQVPVLSINQPTPQTQAAADGIAPLLIDKVATTKGAIATITVNYGTGSQQVAVLAGTSHYPVTVTGLTNGQAYSFTVEVCSTLGPCSTSGAIRFVPYGWPDVSGVRASIDGNEVTVRWPAIATHANPNSLTCRIKVYSSPLDGGQPPDLPVDVTSGSEHFTGKPGYYYQPYRICVMGLLPTQEMQVNGPTVQVPQAIVVAANGHTFTSAATGRCLTGVSAASTTTCNSALTTQHWSALGAAPAALKSTNSGRCLDSTSTGAVVLAVCTGTAAQQWSLVSSAYGTMIKDVSTGRCLNTTATGVVNTVVCSGAAPPYWTQT